PLALGPSDDAEWIAWTARTMDTDRAAAFTGLAGAEGVRSRISVRTALDGLARGLRPPGTGHDNRPAFDDAAAVRAVAFGAACAGDPAAAAGRARADAEVTNALDGVAAARAVAAAVAAAAGGGGAEEAVAAALAELPPGTAAGDTAREALAVAGAHPGDPFGCVADLEPVVCDHVYSYGVAAADTLPAAPALVAASGGRVGPAVGAAACIAPLADSLPALAGALAGALSGYSALPGAWRERCRTLAGCCLPETAGLDLVALADALADRSPSGGDGPGPDQPEQHEGAR